MIADFGQPEFGGMPDIYCARAGGLVAAAGLMCREQSTALPLMSGLKHMVTSVDTLHVNKIN